MLIVRATDKGTPQLFTDTEVYVTVGDVSSNDGVPSFVRPKPKEVAYIAENARPGSKVFQVEAVDPDDPQTGNGQLVYSLPEDGVDIRGVFLIDPATGTLTTKVISGVTTYLQACIIRLKSMLFVIEVYFD